MVLMKEDPPCIAVFIPKATFLFLVVSGCCIYYRLEHLLMVVAELYKGSVGSSEAYRSSQGWQLSVITSDPP